METFWTIILIILVILVMSAGYGDQGRGRVGYNPPPEPGSKPIFPDPRHPTNKGCR